MPDASVTVRIVPTPPLRQALDATDAIFELVKHPERTAHQIEANSDASCAGQAEFDYRPNVFSSIWHLEEFMLQTWTANFGSQPAVQPQAARTLAVSLEKRESRQWDVSCAAFCSFLRQRRQNVPTVDHYALKYHYLRNLDYKPPLHVSVERVMKDHAAARQNNVSDMMLPHSNVLIRHLLRTCVGNRTAPPTEPECIV